MKYTDEEYEDHIKESDENWTKEETDKLLELMEIFEGNFLVITDRWPSHLSPKTIEDIKERIFNLFKILEEVRDVDNKRFSKFKYDKHKERLRKLKSEKYLTRP